MRNARSLTSSRRSVAATDSVFVYWDNSNVFPEARRHAEERESGPDARYRVRVHFENLLRLAHAD